LGGANGTTKKRGEEHPGAGQGRGERKGVVEGGKTPDDAKKKNKGKRVLCHADQPLKEKIDHLFFVPKRWGETETWGGG